MKPGKNSARSRLKLIRAAALSAWLLLLLLPTVSRAQPSAPLKRVLVLYWYDRDYPGHITFGQSFQATLQAASGGTFECYSEYLESNRFPGEKQELLLRDFLRQKYADRPIDVLVAATDASLKFLLKYRADLFPQAPIVFHVTQRPPATELAAGPGLTGIILINTHRETIDLALKLHPGTEQVFIISGTLERDKRFEIMAREQLQGYENKVRLTYLTDLSPDELVAQTKSLPERSLVLYLWQQSLNKDGKLLETADVLALIAAASPVPIYGMSARHIGNGLVGGQVYTTEALGRRTAELVWRIAQGERAQDIPVESATTVPMFDWRQLHRWGISDDQLPPGSIVRFKELSFWKEYQGHIIGTMALIAVQALLIALLLLERARRQRATQRLRESETALLEKEQHLREAQGIAQMGSFHWDLAANTVAWSDELHRIHGLQPGESSVTYETYLEQVHPDYREQVRQAVEHTLAKRKPFEHEYRIVRPTGETRWMFAHGRPVVDADGTLLALQGICQDITERKRTEQALRESEARFRSAFDDAAIGMALVAPDTRPLQVNHSLCELLGYSEQELLATSFQAITHPDDVDFCQAQVRRSVIGETDAFQMEKRYIHKQGHIVWVLVSASPLRGSDGEPLYFISQVQDISEQKQAAEALRESEARFRNMADYAPVMVWVTEADGTCTYASQSWYELTGQTPETGLGFGWVAALHPDDREVSEKTFLAANEKREAFQLEYRLRREDGEYRWVIDSARPRCGPQGEFLGYIGSVVDITERKRTEEALRTSQMDYASLVNSIDGIVWELEYPSMKFSFVSQQAERLLGYPVKNWLDDPDFWADHIHPDDRAGAINYCAEATKKGQDHQFEYRMICADGRVIWLRDIVTVEMRDGQPVCLRGLLVDITARKQSEAARRESEERFRSAFDYAPIGMALMATDGRFLQVNRVVLELLGYTEAELLATDFQSLTHPDDLEADLAYVHRILAGEIDMYQMEKRYIHKHGHMVWALLSASLLRAPDGQPLYFIAQIQDVTEQKQAEAAIRESEEKFRQLAENIGAAFFITEGFDEESAGRVVYVSPAYEQIWGRSRESVYQDTRSWLDAVHPEDRPRVSAALQNIEQAQFDEEFRIVRPDGEIRWAHDRVFPIYNEQGEIYRLAGIVEDITERKQTEEAQRESERKFRAVYDEAAIGIALVDREGRLLESNRALQQMLGYSAEELRYLSFLKFTYPNDVEINLHLYRRLIRGESDHFRIEQRYFRKDGRLLWANLTISLVRDDRGHPKFSLAMVEDITQRKQAGEELRRSEAKFSGILSIAADAIVSIDEAQKITLFNDGAERIFGYSKDEVLGQPLDMLIPEESRRAHQHHIHQFAASPVASRRMGERQEIFARRKGGEVFPSEASISKLVLGDEKIFTVVLRDISERKQAEEELNRLNAELEERIAARTGELKAKTRELETFAYSVAHDLKAPLRGIEGYSRLLLEHAADHLDEEGGTLLYAIRTSTARMNQLIDDLLAYSRLERRELSFSPIDLQAFIAALIAERRNELDGRQIQLGLKVNGESVMADASGLGQVLRNYLDNAIKFTRDVSEPQIEIGAEETKKHCRLWVRDNGIGFDMKYHDRVFDIFQRLHKAEDYPGTGVGLAIVRKVMERLGGRVWAESAPGQGATFYLELPKLKKPTAKVK